MSTGIRSTQISSQYVFDTLDTHKDISIQSSALKSIYKQPVQLNSAMEIYKIQRALMRITVFVTKQLQQFKSDWAVFLNELNGYECQVKNSYSIHIDTTLASAVLNKCPSNVQYWLADLAIPETRQRLVDFLIEMDGCTFRENHSFAFLDKMLASKEARAFIAEEGKRIVGGLWGFFADYEGKKIFHAWLLVIRPDFSSLGVAKQLTSYAEREGKNYMNLSVVTLNVDNFNKHAKALYEKAQFTTHVEQPDKSFMGRPATEKFYDNKPVELSAETAKNIVKDYVVRNATTFELARFELVRHATKFASTTYWSYKNPPVETVTLSDDL